MKVTVIDHSADIEQLLSYRVLNLLELALYIKIRMLLNELLHCLVYLRLRIVRGVLLQVLRSDASDHILYSCV